jgi:hypothetical protein
VHPSDARSDAHADPPTTNADANAHIALLRPDEVHTEIDLGRDDEVNSIGLFVRGNDPMQILRPCEAMDLVADDRSSRELLWSAEAADSAHPDWLAFRHRVIASHSADG